MNDEPPAEARRTVSVVFADVVGSTSLGEALDAETVRQLMGRYFAAARAAVERHGGSLEKFIGDAVLAVFGVPTTREDDALRAVRAASDLRRDVALLSDQLSSELGQDLQVRIGVNTGEVVVGAARAGGSFVSGDAVNVAARLEQAAAPGEVLLGASTYLLVRPSVEASTVPPLQARGKSEPLQVWKLHAVLDRRRPEPSRSRFVGRDAPLQALQEVFAHVARRRRCEVVTVLGGAGEGKTRLSEELHSRLDGSATVLRGRCLSYGEAATFWPLREVVLEAAGLRGDETPQAARAALSNVLGDAEDVEALVLRLSHLAGFEGRARAPEDLGWAVRVLLERLCVRRPVVLVIDDVHWAEPGPLDTLAHVATRSQTAPIMLLLLSRPELIGAHDAHGQWFGRTLITLDPLDADAISGLLQGLQLPNAVRGQLLSASGGNPLFAEQLVAKMLDDGLLVDRDGQLTWVASAEAPLAMPPTISALLSARLDLLTRQERSTLERASVVGAVFYQAALQALAGADRADVAAILEQLTRKGLVRPADSDLPGLEPAHAFVHALVRDAAYAGIAKATRADLHERVANWLQTAAGVTVPQEVVGTHLEQAFRYRQNLRLDAARTRELAQRAAHHLRGAAERLEVCDASGAAALLTRCAALLPAGSQTRLEAVLDLGQQLYELGRFSEALAAANEAERSTDDAMAARGRLLRTQVISVIDQTYNLDTNEQVISEVVPLLEKVGDDRGLSDAYLLHAGVEVLRTRFARCGRLMEKAVLHAARAQDETRLARARAYSFLVYLFGPTPAEEAIAISDALAQQSPTDLRLRAYMEQATCVLHAMCGRFEQARRIAEHTRRDLEAVGQTFSLANLAQSTGPVEELAGNRAAADREYTASRLALRELGEAAYLSTVAGLHARLLARAGRVEEAWGAVNEAAAAGAADDVMTQSLISESRALLLARAGDGPAAASAAHQAVTLATGGEAPDSLAEAHAVAATVFAWLGRRADSTGHLHLAHAAFAQKGNTVRAAAMFRAVSGGDERLPAPPFYVF